MILGNKVVFVSDKEEDISYLDWSHVGQNHVGSYCNDIILCLLSMSWKSDNGNFSLVNWSRCVHNSRDDRPGR